jgi:phage tail sheath protein FI
VSLSAHTLSADPALLQISVRRLLIFLRKLCLQRGTRYVFQANTDRFRQLVRDSFETMLSALVQVQAITNFQVITDASTNTPGDVANGRLVIQVLVAPTNPVEFITITLVRGGEGVLDVLEGWS